MSHAIHSPIHSDSLADVLERVLDKGVVIAGDVTVSLVGIELLSVKLRLLITTVDKAIEMGIDWWAHDPSLTGGAGFHHGSLESAEGAPRLEPPAPPIAAPIETVDPARLAVLTQENRELRGRLAILEKRLQQLGV
ncbi:MAG: gas vesicle protein GvpJ [Pseudomonadota bacterium]